MLSFCQNYFLGIKYVSANVQCPCIVYTNFQNAPGINIGGVKFLIHTVNISVQKLPKISTLYIIKMGESGVGISAIVLPTDGTSSRYYDVTFQSNYLKTSYMILTKLGAFGLVALWHVLMFAARGLS